MSRIEQEVAAVAVIEAPPAPVRGGLDLLFLAVERGVAASDLAALVALQRDAEQRQEQRDFSAALARFQAECPSIKKGKEAKFATKSGGNMQYTYASLDQIARVVNPILAAHGLSYSWVETVEGSSLTCTCIVRHAHGGSNQASITLPTTSQSMMSDQQKVGAALTFGRRLSLTSALGLTTTDDDIDGAEPKTATLSDAQIATLEELVVEKTASLNKLLAFMRVESLAEILEADYPKAFNALSSLKPKAPKDAQ